jgi:hypothetical protein
MTWRTSIRTKAATRKPSPFCQRALAIREKALGPEHLDVVQSLSTLA